MLAFELRDDPFHRAFRPERRPAADAVERLLLLHHTARRTPSLEIKLRHDRNDPFRTGRRAKSPLNAGAFRGVASRLLLAFGESARRTDGSAGEAKRAAHDMEAADPARYSSGSTE